MNPKGKQNLSVTWRYVFKDHYMYIYFTEYSFLYN